MKYECVERGTVIYISFPGGKPEFMLQNKNNKINTFSICSFLLILLKPCVYDIFPRNSSGKRAMRCDDQNSPQNLEYSFCLP